MPRKTRNHQLLAGEAGVLSVLGLLLGFTMLMALPKSEEIVAIIQGAGAPETWGLVRRAAPRRHPRPGDRCCHWRSNWWDRRCSHADQATRMRSKVAERCCDRVCFR